MSFRNFLSSVFPYFTLHYAVALYSSIIRFVYEYLKLDEEKRNAIEKLTLKYAPESSPERRAAAIDREWDRLCMLEFQGEHMSGKEAIELVKKGKEAENQFD